MKISQISRSTYVSSSSSGNISPNKVSKSQSSSSQLQGNSLFDYLKPSRSGSLSESTEEFIVRFYSYRAGYCRGVKGTGLRKLSITTFPHATIMRMLTTTQQQSNTASLHSTSHFYFPLKYCISSYFSDILSIRNLIFCFVFNLVASY